MYIYINIVASGSQWAPQPVFEAPLRRFSCADSFPKNNLRRFSCALLKMSTEELGRSRLCQTLLKYGENYNLNIQIA